MALRDRWHQLKAYVAPGDRLLLALGAALALASGVGIARAGDAVSLALGAFATTPVDAAAVSTAVRDLLWLAGGLFLAETVASLAFARVAAHATSAWIAETRRHLKERGEYGGDALEHAESKIQLMEQVNQREVAPALHGLVQSVALLVTTLVLDWTRSEDALLLSLIVIAPTLYTVSSSYRVLSNMLPTVPIENPTDWLVLTYAKYELAEMRAIATHNAQEVVSATHGKRIGSSRIDGVFWMTFRAVMPAQLIGCVWFFVWILPSWWARFASQRAAVPAREAFEELGTPLLSAAAAVRLLAHWLSLQRLDYMMTELETTNKDASQKPSHCTSARKAMSVRRVFQLLQPDRTMLSIGVLGAIAIGAGFAWLVPFVSGALVKTVAALPQCEKMDASPPGPQTACLHYLRSFVKQDVMLVATCGMFVISFLSFYAFRRLGARIYRRVLSLHVEAAFRQSVRHFEVSGNGVDGYCAARDSLPSDASSMCRRTGSLLLTVTSTLGALIVLLASGPLTVTLPILVLVILIFLVNRVSHKTYAGVGSHLNTLLHHTSGGVTLMKTLIPVVAFSYGTHLVERGLAPSFSDIVAPLVAVPVVLISANLTSTLIGPFREDWQRTVNACKVITDLQTQAIGSTNCKTIECAKPLGRIDFHNVSFDDPVNKDLSSLKRLSLTIDAGETVVFCGPPGGGHEHIVTLLEKFYDPASGTVRIDGKDLKEVDPLWLREQIAVLNSEPILFEGSIADNISVGCGRVATQDEIQHAAKFAHAHDAIVEDLIDGYASQVIPATKDVVICSTVFRRTFAERRTMTVSKRDGSAADKDLHHRIALARAYLKDPSVLVLSNATRHVASESLKVVQQGISRLVASKKRTTVIIGHDLPAVVSADRIYVFKDGEIVEQGTHEQLVAKAGSLYRWLVE